MVANEVPVSSAVIVVPMAQVCGSYYLFGIDDRTIGVDESLNVSGHISSVNVQVER